MKICSRYSFNAHNNEVSEITHQKWKNCVEKAKHKKVRSLTKALMEKTHTKNKK